MVVLVLRTATVSHVLACMNSRPLFFVRVRSHKEAAAVFLQKFNGRIFHLFAAKKGLENAMKVGPALRLMTMAVLTSFRSTATVAQNAKLEAGTLTCQGQGSVGLVLGSQEKLVCDFTSAAGALVQRYNGTITRVGLDVGVRGKSVMIWSVLGSTTELPGEALGGSFAGVSADVSAGIGVGANALVGGNDKSVVLQPLSVSGGTGVNIAVGVSGLSLKPI